MRRIAGLTRFAQKRLVQGWGLLGVVAFVLAAGVYTTGVRVESADSFCASCHVEPETTYYLQSVATESPGSLAAFHAGERTRCIDCHSRRWVPGRLWAQWGGLQNLLAFRSGDYANPAETTRPVGEGGCVKCHGDLTWTSERPGHYHSPWLRWRWRAAAGPVNTCEACHPSHAVVAPAAERFMEAEHIEEQCEACHGATGAGSPATQ